MNSELLFLYVLVFPYIFLLFDCFELALIDCIGRNLKIYLNLTMSYYFYMHWYFLIYSYYLTVLNRCSFTPAKSENLRSPAIWCFASRRSFHITLTFPYIFLFVHCFKWALIGMQKRRGWGVNFKIYPTCMFHMSLHWLGGVNLQIYPGKSENLPLVSSCLLYALVFTYIFLMFDCFKWVLIDCIEKCRVHSVLWQFWGG